MSNPLSITVMTTTTTVDLPSTCHADPPLACSASLPAPEPPAVLAACSANGAGTKSAGTSATTGASTTAPADDRRGDDDARPNHPGLNCGIDGIDDWRHPAAAANRSRRRPPAISRDGSNARTCSPREGSFARTSGRASAPHRRGRRVPMTVDNARPDTAAGCVPWPARPSTCGTAPWWRLLDVLGGRRERELLRGVQGTDATASDFHEHLPGLLLGPVAARHFESTPASPTPSEDRPWRPRSWHCPGPL